MAHNATFPGTVPAPSFHTPKIGSGTVFVPGVPPVAVYRFTNDPGTVPKVWSLPCPEIPDWALYQLWPRGQGN